MIEFSISFKSQTYRRKARACDDLAICARSAADRDQLWRLRDSWLSLAANEDRLGGLPPFPPANTTALAAPRYA